MLCSVGVGVGLSGMWYVRCDYRASTRGALYPTFLTLRIHFIQLARQAASDLHVSSLQLALRLKADEPALLGPQGGPAQYQPLAPLPWSMPSLLQLQVEVEVVQLPSPCDALAWPSLSQLGPRLLQRPRQGWWARSRSLTKRRKWPSSESFSRSTAWVRAPWPPQKGHRNQARSPSLQSLRSTPLARPP